MSLRVKLLLTFVGIALLVVVIMGVYQARLFESRFRATAADQLLQQGPRIQTLLQLFPVAPGTAASGQLAAAAAAMSQSRALMTDNSGVILWDSSDGSQPEGSSLVGYSVSHDLIGKTLKQGNIVLFDFPTAGTDSIALAIPWVSGGKIAGSLILTRPLKTAAREAAREAGAIALRAALVATAIAVIAAYLLSSSITKPLRAMVEAARSISKGNFKEKVPVESDDELGELAEAMNSMSLEISNLIDNLTEEKDKLRAFLDERTNMLSDISHDLRTPITSIKGFVEALKDGLVKDDTERAHTLDIIHEESERLSRLIDDLFYLARLESGELPVEMKEMNLAMLVRNAVETAEPLGRDKGVRLSLNVSGHDEDYEVVGSWDRLTRAILNVLDNAVKYSPASGQVRVDLKTTPRKNGASSEAVVSVADSGPGIPTQDIPHIFERFYRTDKSRSRAKSGAGLGLSIAKLVLEQHGGSIWVESQLGQGTTFFMSIPLKG